MKTEFPQSLMHPPPPPPPLPAAPPRLELKANLLIYFFNLPKTEFPR